MATIIIVNGRQQGEWYTVGIKPMVFGRDDELLAELLDPRVSRRHLEVRHDLANNRYIAFDLGSHNGTRINGDLVTEATTLKEGDLIQIGHTLLSFTDAEFDDDRQVRGHLEKTRAGHEELIVGIDQREQNTAAASLFARIFSKRLRSRPPDDA